MFVNIDRIFWSQKIDPEDIGNRAIQGSSYETQEYIDYLRALFLDHSNLGASFSRDIDNSDPIRVLIVDEVRSSGRTLAYATNMFQAAFPNVRFEGHHWMSTVTTNGSALNGSFIFGDGGVPVWYRDDTPLGRGVGDPERGKACGQINYRDKGRAWFLSSRLEPQERESSDQLRTEIKQLAEDVREHRVFVRPSNLYGSLEDYSSRLQQLNPGLDMEEIKESIKKLAEDWHIKSK